LGDRTVIVIDVEIAKAVPPRKGEPPLPEGIEVCQGWRDFEGMGISTVCTYDINTHLSRVFLEEDLAELSRYLDGKYTAGFNTKRFDIPLLREWGPIIDLDTHYDMLEQIWLALGLNPDKFYYKTHGGWGLDAVCDATLGIRKTGHGALAPVWWQQGRRGKVIDYCCNDVWMEGSLLRHIIQHGWVIRDTTVLTVKRPHEVLAEVSPPVDRQYHRADGTTTVAGPGFKQRYPGEEPLAAAPERSPGGYVPGPGKQPDNLSTSGTGGSGLGIIR
jgi:hypothetical protein